MAAARENARQVREQISTEMWEQLNRLYLNISRSRASRGSAFYMHVKEAAHLFQGVTDSTMIHTEGWHYIQIGRSIERAGGDSDDARDAFRRYRRRRSRRRHRRLRVVDGAASLVFGVRGVLPALHGRRPARAGRRVPPAERRFSAIGALCDRHASKPRFVRSPGRSGEMRRAASIGSPAACGPRSTTARSTRSWPTAFKATSRAYAGSASTSTPRCTRPTSATRPSPPSRHERRDSVPHSSHEPVYVQRAHQREHDGGAHAAARRRAAALPAVRVDDRSPARASSRTRIRSAMSCTISTSRAGTRVCG